MTTPPSVEPGGVGGVASGLSDLLECSVCLEPLGADHRVLPCQHTFCLTCLEDLEAKRRQGRVDDNAVLFLCPECRAEVHTPISTLPTNVILNRILYSGLSSSSSSSTPKNVKTAAADQTSSQRLKKDPPKPPPLAIGDHRKLPVPVGIKLDNNNISGKDFTVYSSCRGDCFGQVWS